jgi:hypothetical protein
MAALIEFAGDQIERLLTPGPHELLGAARTRGAVSGRTGAAAAWVLIEGGAGRLRVGDTDVTIAGREDVFEGSGWSATIPPQTRFALEGALRATVVWRPSDRPRRRRRGDPR